MNAERLYQQYKKEKEVQGRLAQIVRMAAACRTEYEAVSPKDSLQKKTYNTTEGDNATMQLKSISTIIKSLTSTMLSKPVIPVLVKDIISKKEKTNLQK